MLVIDLWLTCLPSFFPFLFPFFRSFELILFVSSSFVRIYLNVDFSEINKYKTKIKWKKKTQPKNYSEQHIWNTKWFFVDILLSFEPTLLVFFISNFFQIRFRREAIEWKLNWSKSWKTRKCTIFFFAIFRSGGGKMNTSQNSVLKFFSLATGQFKL